MSDDRSDPSRVRQIPLLPLRDIVVFPHQVVPLWVGRERSLVALEEAMSESSHREIFFSAQRHADNEEPTAADIFEIGTLGSILQLLRMPDSNVKVLVEGRRRGMIRRFIDNDGYFLVEAEDLPDQTDEGVELLPLSREVRSSFETFVRLNTRIAPELVVAVQSIEKPSVLADTIIGHLPLVVPEKQALLEILSPTERLTRLYELLTKEIELVKVERRIKNRVKRRAERVEKQHLLNEQVQGMPSAPATPAGKDGDPRDEFKGEIDELEARAAKKKMSAEATARVEKEIRKLRLMAPMSAEASVVRNYVDWVLGLPWGDKSPVRADVGEAERVLDEEHHGLKRVKERILEHLAVQSLAPRAQGPILCLVGPPGVGKTSLARSIAKATGRNFVRLALGGVRDEAEIRGHRRTYIGALPGKIVQSLKKAGSDNPLFLLDEVDKMSADFRGDPAAALLEVLDPEQNKAFVDHYLDLEYDLSEVMFLTTANYLQNIPAPLQDRLEIIQISGYTEMEKVAIAERHLLPRQRRDNGIEALSLKVPEDTLRAIVGGYTKEAGVRGLEREIGTICRKIAREYSTDRTLTKWRVTAGRLSKFLGPSKFRAGRREERDEIGVVNGLAVTAHGGDLLTAEVSIVSGKGKLVLTGKLGDVMQESAQAALSYVRARSLSLGLDSDFHARADIHVHIPEGAIPKDGPSAGITICTALASALLRIPVRSDVAMTGEITLRGRVLPIGGLKEKILAAHRGGVKKVIIPADNARELRDVPQRILKAMKIVPVAHMDEVLRAALVLPDPNEFLKGPSVAADWRVSSDRRQTDRRGDPMPVASAVPPTAPVAPVAPGVAARAHK